MIKFGVFLLCCIVIQSINCGVVKREERHDNVIYRNPIAEATPVEKIIEKRQVYYNVEYQPEASIILSENDDSLSSIEDEEDNRYVRQLDSYGSPQDYQQNVFQSAPTVAAQSASSSYVQSASSSFVQSASSVASPSPSDTQSSFVQSAPSVAKPSPSDTQSSVGQSVQLVAKPFSSDTQSSVGQSVQLVAKPSLSGTTSSPVSKPSYKPAAQESESTGTASSSTPHPLAALTAIFANSNAKGGNNNGGVPDLVGGAIGAATTGVQTVLAVKRDLLLPVVMSILSLVQNVANSEVLKTIIDVKLNAARTVLSIGPAMVDALANVTSTAGKFTSSVISALLCNIVCPIQKDPNACSVQASCEKWKPNKASPAPSQDYGRR